MVLDRHNNIRPITYGLVSRQLLGVSAIIALALSAWLTLLLPLNIMTTLAFGYGIGLLLFISGALLAARGFPPGKTLLGGGMAFIFLTTRQGLFTRFPNELLFAMPGHPYSSGAICLGLLVLFGVASWRAHSQSTALTTLGLGAYLMWFALPRFVPAAQGYGIIVVAALTAAWVWHWRLYRHGVLFPQTALAVLYAAYWYFLRPALPDNANQALLLIVPLFFLYALLSTTEAVGALRRQPPNQGAYLFILSNTAFFLLATGALLAHSGVGRLWAAPVAVTLISGGIVACLCHSGIGGGVLSLHMTQAALALVAVVALPLPSGPRVAALAGLCVAPALLGHWRPARLLRVSEFVLAAAVLIASFFIETPQRYALAGPVGIPVYWVYLLGAAGLLLMVARLHEGWAHGNGPAREYKPEQELLALTYACAAALLVVLHTILKRGDSELLLIILSAQGVLCVGLGMTIASPIIAVTGLIPVVAAHTCYYLYPLLVDAPVPEQDLSPWMMGAMVAAALAPALANDRLVRARVGAATSPATALAAAAPYLPALLLAITSCLAAMPALYLPPWLCIAAVALLSTRMISGPPLPGLSGVGYVLALLAALGYCYALQTHAAHDLSWHLPLVGVYLLGALAIERLTTIHLDVGSRARLAVSHALVFLPLLVGVTAIHAWNSGFPFAVALMALAMCLAISGYVVRASVYYHAALFLILGAALHLLLFTRYSVSSFT